jgi:hypothetical protein
MFDKIIIARLKKKVMAEPHIGMIDNDGTYVYRDDSYIVKYEILGERAEGTPVRIISIKHKISDLERKRKDAAKSLQQFFFHYGWISFFRPRTLLFFTLGAVIFYLGVIEPYRDKVNRFRWIVANVIGVNPKQLEYDAGVFHLFGKREPAGKQSEEYITFSFSPFNLLLSKNTGYVSRWSKEAGYVTNPVSFDDSGNVWLGLGNDSLKHGFFSGDEVKWDTFQAIDNGGISGEKISNRDNTLYITDQE